MGACRIIAEPQRAAGQQHRAGQAASCCSQCSPQKAGKAPKCCWTGPPGGWCPALAPPRTSARQPPWSELDGGCPRGLVHARHRAPGTAPGLSMPCSSCAQARDGAGEFLQHPRGAPQTPGGCSAPRWSLGRSPGAGCGWPARLREANQREHGLAGDICPHPAPSHSQHKKGEEKSLLQHRQQGVLEATITLQEHHTALEAQDEGSLVRLGGRDLVWKYGG